MSENNEADALFATRRKKQQDEEAQKAARIAEEKRLAEIELQKQEVAKEIERLEKLQALQKAQEEEQRLSAEKAKADEEAQKDAQKAQKAAPKEASGAFDIKKYLPFILIGAGVLVVVVVVIIILSSGSKNSTEPDNPVQAENTGNGFSSLLTAVDWYRTTDESSGVTYVYPSVFDRVSEEDEGEYGFYYVDASSFQYIWMGVYPSEMTQEEDEYYIPAIISLILTSEMEEEGITDCKIGSYGNNIWYIYDFLDDKGADGYMTAKFIAKKNGVMIELDFMVGHEDASSQRFVDIEDIVNMVSIMVEKLSVG